MLENVFKSFSLKINITNVLFIFNSLLETFSMIPKLWFVIKTSFKHFNHYQNLSFYKIYIRDSELHIVLHINESIKQYEAFAAR